MKPWILVFFALLLANPAIGQSDVLSSVDFSLDTNLLCSFPRVLRVTYTGKPVTGIGYKPAWDHGDGYMAFSPEYTFDWQWENGGFRKSGTGMGPFEINYDGFSGVRRIILTVTRTTAPFDKVVIIKEVVIYYLGITAIWEDATCSNKKGKIHLIASDGTPPYQYSVDGVNFQNDSLFIVDPAIYPITIKDANNCVTGKTLGINEPEKTWVRTIENPDICVGKQVQLSVNSNATGFSWEPATGLDNPAVKDPVANPTFTTQYIVTATNNDCTGSAKDTVLVTVVPEIVLNITPDSEIDPGTPFQLNTWTTVPGATTNASYTWSPPLGLSDPEIANPVATISSLAAYSVQVTSPEGCSATAQVKLSITSRPTILIPSAFSPNGDGNNETFIPIVRKNINLLNFKIYNRWGNVIFSSNQQDHGWDGRFNGEHVAGGNYVYKVEGITDTGQTIKKEGTVMLIR